MNWRNQGLSFLGQHYLQVHGTVMGTRMAFSFASFFISELNSQRPRGFWTTYSWGGEPDSNPPPKNSAILWVILIKLKIRCKSRTTNTNVKFSAQSILWFWRYGHLKGPYVCKQCLILDCMSGKKCRILAVLFGKKLMLRESGVQFT